MGSVEYESFAPLFFVGGGGVCFLPNIRELQFSWAGEMVIKCDKITLFHDNQDSDAEILAIGSILVSY